MQCKDIMRRPVQVVRQDDTIQAAARKMRDANVGILPVCDANGRALGVITDRDMALRVCADGLAPSQTVVGEVFTRKVVACRESDGLEEAERLMARHRTSRILVTGPDDKLAGIISLSDVAVRDDLHAAEILRKVAEREVLGEGGLRH